MSHLVIDLSHHNSIPSSLEPAADSGVLGIIHKATEGGSYVDDKCQARYHLAKEAGMLWGTYHFLRETPSGPKQAEFYVKTMQQLGVLDDQTLVAADHEDTDAVLTLLRDFLLTLRDLTGRSPVVYSGHVLKDQLRDYVGEDFPVRLWLAQYGPKAELPNGFSSYYLWQYTDQGEVAGIQPPTDLNSYEGTEQELMETWSGKAVKPPEPVPEPEVQVVQITVKAPPGVRVEVTQEDA